MTDRELLEYAAKAGGIEIGQFIDRIDEYYSGWEGCSGFELPKVGYWNSLIDRAQALDLAVLLDIEVHPDSEVGEVHTAFCITDKNGNRFGLNTHEEYGLNPSLATCRAITRAAAEIGRAMT